MYAQVRGNVPEMFDVFLGSVAPNGYAWIIPKGPDTANVGLGVRAGKLDGRLKDHLRTFCDNLDLEILEVGGGWIPMGGPVKRMVDGNAMAVGDAAGLVMPSNGGGISQAIILDLSSDILGIRAASSQNLQETILWAGGRRSSEVLCRTVAADLHPQPPLTPRRRSGWTGTRNADALSVGTHSRCLTLDHT